MFKNFNVHVGNKYNLLAQFMISNRSNSQKFRFLHVEEV